MIFFKFLSRTSTFLRWAFFRLIGGSIINDLLLFSAETLTCGQVREEVACLYIHKQAIVSEILMIITRGNLRKRDPSTGKTGRGWTIFHSCIYPRRYSEDSLASNDRYIWILLLDEGMYLLEGVFHHIVDDICRDQKSPCKEQHREMWGRCRHRTKHDFRAPHNCWSMDSGGQNESHTCYKCCNDDF